MISERFLITIVAALLAIAAHLFFMKHRFLHWWILSVSTLLLTCSLLLYYHIFIVYPSHGVGIVILPLGTWWLVWRRQTTGKPALSAQLFVVLQVVFSVLYVIITRIQEY